MRTQISDRKFRNFPTLNPNNFCKLLLRVKLRNLHTKIVHPFSLFLLSENKIYRMNVKKLPLNFTPLYFRAYAEFRKLFAKKVSTFKYLSAYRIWEL